MTPFPQALWKTYNVTHLNSPTFKNDTTVMKFITRSYDSNHIVEIKFKSWDFLLLNIFPNSTAEKRWKVATKLEQDIHGNVTRFAYSYKFQQANATYPTNIGGLLDMYPALSMYFTNKSQPITPGNWENVNESHSVFIYCPNEQTAGEILLTLVKDEIFPVFRRAELAFRFWTPWSICCQQAFYTLYWELLNYPQCISELLPMPTEHIMYANCPVRPTGNVRKVSYC